MPWNSLYPDFRATLTMAPGFQPYSARQILLKVELLNRIDGKNRRRIPEMPAPLTML